MCHCNEKPLVIQAGKTYLDVMGNKYRVLATDMKNDYSVIALREAFDGTEYVSYFNKNGKSEIYSISRKCDLAREYKEPITHKRDIVWCSFPNGELYCTVVDANSEPLFKELKRQTVEYIEEG